MFTGIVEEVGHVRTLTGGAVDIMALRVLDGTKVGDSIAVNGVCLTVTTLTDSGFTADVMPETMRKTSLAALRPGSAVNLERALLPTTRLGGHIVSGHIDGVGRIASVSREGNSKLLRVIAGKNIMRYVVAEGSVAIDGVSLTVASISPDDFVVSLIPHTSGVTALDEKRAGDAVNIENDIIGKYVEHLIRYGGGSETGITMEFLSGCGF